MAAAANRPVRASGTATFSALQIDRRVLTTSTRTIAIQSIATVSVGTHVEHRPRALMWAGAVVLAIMAAAATQVGIVADGKINYVSVALGVIAAGLAVFALKPDDKTHYLLIASNDGVVTRFPGPDRAVLEEARRILSDKINSANETATFNVNFETGVIENLAVAQGGPAYGAQAPVQPPGRGGAPASPSYGRAATTEPLPVGGRAALSPPRAGAVNGLARAPSDGFVDFSAVLPAVVEMHRFYARQPNAQHLEQRLSELELLMRAGAQTEGQKSRVRELTKDLSHILQAYQPAVQILNQISGLAA
ncbi:MAG: DUF6232 family protein [Hyphomicrobium sp.]